jgi:Caspase domain
MKKRALVIGSQTFGLTGVLSDTERMARGLKALGFEVESCVQADATRAGILAAYRRLIDASGKGDCAVVYYSGHGARLAVAAGAGPADSYMQLIIPTDFGESTDNDFRGLTALELSMLQGALTEKTHNVTVVLDCCHSSAMSRAPELDATVKSLDDFEQAAKRYEELRSRDKSWPQRVTEHLARLRQQGTVPEGPFLESNPHAVRLAAAGVDQSAWEYTNASGLRTGILTECFLTALEEARELAVSWEVLGRRIREQVLARFPVQRPEVEGPVRRVIFGLDEPVPQPSLPYFTDAARHWLRGGRLHGVQVGDEYALMPPYAMQVEPNRALARARVIDVRADWSEVTLEPELPPGLDGAVAFRTRSLLPRRPIDIEAPSLDAERHEAVRAELEMRLKGSTLVRRSTGVEDGPVLAHVCFTADTIELRDRDKVLVARQQPAVVKSVGLLIENLEAMARAQSLRELESGTDAHALTEPFSIEWGRVVAKQPQPLPESGACLAPGERFYVCIRNEGHTKLYATVFDVGVSSRIALFNSAEPSGMLIEPGMERWLGKRPGAVLEGFELAWPDSVPTTGVRGLESLVIIVSTAPQDLRSLEAQGVRGAAFKAPTSPLEGLVQQAAWGGKREAVIQADAVRYAVRSVSFLLEPPKPK